MKKCIILMQNRNNNIVSAMMIATAALLLLLLSEPVAAGRDAATSSSSSSTIIRGCFVSPNNHRHHHHSPNTSLSLSTVYVPNNNNNNNNNNNKTGNNKKQRRDHRNMSLSSSSYVNMPPYGTIRKFTILSSSMNNNMMMDDGYYPNNNNNNNNCRDDRWQKKMKSRNRVADPIIQDFGTKDDWEASKHGLGFKKGGMNNNNNRMGMNMNMAAAIGDDINMIQVDNNDDAELMMMEEQQRDRNMAMERERSMMEMERNNMAMEEEERAIQQQQQQERDRMLFDGDGGNFWVNPMNKLDRYPNGGAGPPPSRRNNRRRNNDEEVGRGRGGGGGEFWETTRNNGAGRALINDEFFEDDDYYDEEEDDYGTPPPSRSRSSFRSGGPSPPRPIKGFYDKLFWFGFDPDVTRPTDRTMFGGTRGKFNAMDLLRDRDERQQRRMMRDMRRGGRDPVIQDFGNAGSDWDTKKFGKGRTGGDLTSDDQRFMADEMRGMPPPGRPFPGDMPPNIDSMPPPGMPQYDFEPEFFDEEMSRGSQRGRRNRRNRGRRNNDGIDARATAYDRVIGLGPMDDDEYIMMDEDDEYMPFPSDDGRRHRRRGYAYKLDDEDFVDDEYIDIEPTYLSERESIPPRRGRRSWEERALEMDRVPPRGVAAWGPNGPVSDDVQTMAAMGAMDEIKRAKKFLEKKEDMVEDTKEEVVALKADANFYERQLDGVGGSAARTLEKELGLVLRDVEDSQRMLRMARAERDAASRQVENLEARHWALLSEYEATQSFADV